MNTHTHITSHSTFSSPSRAILARPSSPVPAILCSGPGASARARSCPTMAGGQHGQCKYRARTAGGPTPKSTSWISTEGKAEENNVVVLSTWQILEPE